MSATEKTPPGQTDSIAFDFDLPHPPERVWRALTQPELLAQWLLPVFNLDLRTGAAFTFKTQAFPGWDGTVNCQFVTIEPHRKLSFTWGTPGMDTVVEFTLAPTTTGTRLSLVQSGFKPEQNREFGGARYGWKMMAGRLVEVLGSLP